MARSRPAPNPDPPDDDHDDARDEGAEVLASLGGDVTGHWVYVARVIPGQRDAKLHRYEAEEFDELDVGAEFGGGEYRAQVRSKRGGTWGKQWTFSCASDIPRRQPRRPAPYAAPAEQPAQAPAAEDPVLTELRAIGARMTRLEQQPAAASAPTNQLEMFRLALDTMRTFQPPAAPAASAGPVGLDSMLAMFTQLDEIIAKRAGGSRIVKDDGAAAWANAAPAILREVPSTLAALAAINPHLATAQGAPPASPAPAATPGAPQLAASPAPPAAAIVSGAPTPPTAPAGPAAPPAPSAGDVGQEMALLQVLLIRGAQSPGADADDYAGIVIDGLQRAGVDIDAIVPVGADGIVAQIQAAMPDLARMPAGLTFARAVAERMIARWDADDGVAGQIGGDA